MHYSDTWNRHIPDSKLAAYKSLVDSDEINILVVTYWRNERKTVVEYESGKTHEEILNELKRRSARPDGAVPEVRKNGGDSAPHTD